MWVHTQKNRQLKFKKVERSNRLNGYSYNNKLKRNIMEIN